MKKYLIVAVLTMSFALAQGQGSPGNKDFLYVPQIYNAAAGGDSIATSQFVNISTVDTLEGIVLDGWSNVFFTLSQATGTAGGIIVKYLGSTDGKNWSTKLVTLDSLNWTAATAKKTFNLANLMGFHSVRLVLVGSDGPAFAGVNYYSAQVRKKRH